MKIIRVAFLYFLFGLICILGDFFFIFVIIFRLNKFQKVRTFCRFLVRNFWGFFIEICKKVGYLEYKFEALNLGKSGELIVANHPSLLDVVFFISKVRNLNCVVKGGLGKNPFLLFAIRACGYILNTNNEEFLNKSMEILKNGESLLIFPEGTRTKDEIKFHKAAFFVAIKAAKTITPVVINLPQKALKKGQNWSDTPDEKLSYEFEICKSIDLLNFENHRSDPMRIRALQDEIMKNYKELK